MTQPAANSRQTAVPCTLMRGGTSKAAFFLADDLPPAGAERDALLLSAMGYPDTRQIDGIGGGTSLTTKVAIISPSAHPDCDIDYLFGQVVPTESRVDYAPTCGNILAAVGPFAIECGLVPATGAQTTVRIQMRNTHARCSALITTNPEGGVDYTGTARISGVPGTGAPIYLRFQDILGSTCGALFPSGNLRDECDGVAVTCIDHGMPVVIVAAADLGVRGDEAPAVLDADSQLKHRIEAIRIEAGRLMGLGDVAGKVIPKLTLVAPPKGTGHCSTRSFIPHKCHDAIGVLGAVSVASAMLFPGTVAHAFCPQRAEATVDVVIEHPTGSFDVRLFWAADGNSLEGAALLRTARALFRGHVLVPTRTRCVTDALPVAGAVSHD